MALPATPRRFTVEEYLTIERAAEERSQYVDGQIYAMTGASRVHNIIAMNIGSALHTALETEPCEVYQSDMRVQVADTGLYTYPDVVVACPPLHFADEQADMLLNPVVIVEVLSPSTEGFDRGEKLTRYRQMPSLRDYLLVAQDDVRIDHYARRDDGWLLQTYEARDDTVRLAALDVALSVRRVYARVLPDTDETGDRTVS